MSVPSERDSRGCGGPGGDRQCTSNEQAVRSEVHDEIPHVGCTSFAVRQVPASPGDSSSDGEDFAKTLPNTLDSDGDLNVPRKKRKMNPHGTVMIHHTSTTSLSGVGLQLWRGSLLLADHALALASDLKERVCVELGSGTGLASIFLSKTARRVFVTDVGTNVLQNCARNIACNSGFIGREDAAKVRELDWLRPPPWESTPDSVHVGPFACSVEDIQELKNAEVVYAGDTIYDNALTDGFLSCAKLLLLLPKAPVLIIAMEKRWIFTVEQMDTCAPAFDHFMRAIGLPTSRQLRDCPATTTHQSAHRFTGTFRCKRVYHVAVEPGMAWWEPERALSLEAASIDVASVPQRINYKRGGDLELWSIRLIREEGASSGQQRDPGTSR
mmetsp:Transcript_37262/g.105141  ORF Transcript_37262/g.105141 Transcript_37262/m.105141 type:complete len:384 (+) Transcript_37262:171-1322(+)